MDYWALVGHRASYRRPPVEVVPFGWRASSRPSGPFAGALRSALRDAKAVLDVGAGDRATQGLLERLGVRATYASADPDPRHPHEHADFLAVEAQFDAILMLDVVEHLPLAMGLEFLAHAAGLAPTLVLSTPNPAHPTSLHASDLTHVTAWPAHDLRGALLESGFAGVEVHRLQHRDAGPAFRAPLQRAVARALGVDPADELLVVARAR